MLYGFLGDIRVVIDHLDAALIQCWRHVPGVSRKKRVGVLISGSGRMVYFRFEYYCICSNLFIVLLHH